MLRLNDSNMSTERWKRKLLEPNAILKTMMAYVKQPKKLSSSDDKIDCWIIPAKNWWETTKMKRPWLKHVYVHC